jgi:uncharacterized protein (DUF433 family)
MKRLARRLASALAARSPDLTEDGLRAVAALLGTRWTAELAPIPARIEILGSTPAPFAAAAIVAEVLAVRPDADLLAFWLADLVLARQLRWPAPVPLLVGQIQTEAFRGANGRGRIAPGGEGFERAVCLALAQAVAEACRLAADIARRAARLAAAEAQGERAGAASQMLFDEDAMSGSLTTPNLTRWGSRRLFERLATLEAARELTGRSTFRLYGLWRWAGAPKRMLRSTSSSKTCRLSPAVLKTAKIEVAPSVVLHIGSLTRDAVERAQRYAAARDSWIESVEGVQGGRPVIKGSRLTVSAIFGRLSSGDTVEDLMTDYPDIPREAFEASFIYGKTHPQVGRPVSRRASKAA